MKHTFLQAAQYKVKGWVKNASNFAQEHPIIMATGGLVGGALYSLGKSAPSAAPSRPSAPRREAVASSSTVSERPVLLGNMRSL